ncbi:uncharacterized protein JCM6883_007583 [Sporobolomyces salmoneus]|uniref:uncharacterized protein n=1 Tax=Sporobolomyces salmoneus TaxID=183962 RepID=UPI0031761C51
MDAPMGDGAVADNNRPSFEVTLSTGEVVPVDLDEMFNAATEQESIEQLNDLAGMLESAEKNSTVSLWTRFVQECWSRQRWATALHYADQGIRVVSQSGRSTAQIPLLLLKANYHLALSRRAPKIRLSAPRTDPLALPKDPHHPESLHAQTVWPGTPEHDRRGSPMLKEEYWYRVDKDLARVEQLERDNKVARDLRAALAMASGKLDEANRLFEQILSDEPNHLMALTGRARILFSRLSFRPAMKIYQQILQLEPTFLPDPRIGVGLCFWFLGDREKARKAWERSIAVNPSNSTSAQTLLGLLHLNRSRDPLLVGGSKARTKAYELGLSSLQQAFKKDNTIAACMGPLGNHLLIQNANGQGVKQALKLYERSLQFSETRLLKAESHFNLGRALDADPDGVNTSAAMTEYQRAVEANPDMVIAHLGVGMCYIRTEQFPPAINAFETLIRKHPQTVEALVSLASIHTHLAFTFHSLSDSQASRKAAKEAYDSVLRIFAQGKSGVDSAAVDTGGGGSGSMGSQKEIAKSERIRQLANDRDMYIEMARLWSDENRVDRSLKAWQEARRIQVEQELEKVEDQSLLDQDESYDVELEKAEKKVDPRVRNNIAVLLYNKKSYQSATGHFELALGTIGQEFAEKGGELDGGETDAVLTAVTYNLACCYEKEGDVDRAKEGWENVLRGHPEFVDAKARLALLELVQAKGRDKAAWERAHILIKEALTSQSFSPELRALYTYFLFETFQHRAARDFAVSTLKEVSRHDLYALCASGLISYLEGRENKIDSKDAQRQRQSKYTRSAEFFDKALQLDPMCAVAAQGLAIALAEGNLGNATDPSSVAANGANSSTASAMQDVQARQRNARDALLILTKVKESINDASVYVNIGHCHFARDEYERAAENYTTASKRYLDEKSSTVLWYIARAWYFKALKESSFVDLEKAINIGQHATDLHPTDLSAIFNMAVLKQKAIELLYGRTNETRTSAQLRKAFEYLESSQALFNQLLADKTPQKPYQADYPRHRSAYGRSLEGRFQSILDQQLAYEETEAGKINQARQAREEARARQLAEQARLEAERQRQAEALAEQRKKMREENAIQWESMSKQWVGDSDDEKEKRKPGTGGKKRKATKFKDGDEPEASSTDEDAEKPKRKKKAKKEKKPRKSKGEARPMDVDEHYDEDDEDAPIRAPGRKRKGKSSNLVKSAEFIDSEEED